MQGTFFTASLPPWPLVIQATTGAFSSGIFFSIICVILFLGILAILSGAEIAFFSLNPSQLKEMRINDTDKDDRVAKLLQDPKRLLATILIAINFLNVAIVIISTFITTSLFNFAHYPVLAFIIQVVIITVLILFFGEILPKVYATQNSVKLSILMAKPSEFLVKVLLPFSNLLVGSTNFVDKYLAKRSSNISLSELEEAIDITTRNNTPEDDRKILKGIVNFGETEVREIMKPRIYVTAIENTLNYKELLAIILDSGYSRIPVYEENFDKVSGILYIKDLLPYLKEDESFPWQSLIRQAFFIPENKKINDLLVDFQKKKIHLAIVVDEYGGTSGIVTLEDIIEEIVGEIDDEFDIDAEESLYSKLDDHNYLFQGKIPISDFCKIMNVDPETFDSVKGDSGTLAGLILEIVGKIPEQNEKVNFGRFVFRMESVDKRRIKKIKASIADAIEA